MFRSAVLFIMLSVSFAVAQNKPNIIVILSDDMGFSDLGCMGGEIQTPNLDALAANGVRFTQFYNTARCCPTRASLLTGQHPCQAGVGHMLQETGLPGYTGGLNQACRTIAERLQPAGYRSYAVGKWHVTKEHNEDSDQANWPCSRGFDRFYGTIRGAGSYYDPASLIRDNKGISAFADPEYKPKTYYYTDAIAEHAIRFTGEHAKNHAEQPFFLYCAFTCAHWPMQALPEDIARYKGKYDAGFEPIRKARFEKLVKLGLVDPNQPMVKNPVKWEGVPASKWNIACMEVYAAMIDRMDQNIGRLVESLKKNGQFDNTLILFLQDNGACAELQGRTGNEQHPNIDRPAKPTLPAMKPEDFQHRASAPLQTREGYPVRMGQKAFPGPDDTYIAYGKGWATVSNTPFREYKHWVHEGGISTPLIAHWPQGISTKGELRKQTGQLVDIAATCCDLAGAAPIGPKLEGLSLRPAFDNKSLDREALYWEHEGNKAIRVGDWKLVAKHEGPWELYDIARDRIEANDLAKSHTDVVTNLTGMWEAWAKRTNVADWTEVQKRMKK